MKNKESVEKSDALEKSANVEEIKSSCITWKVISGILALLFLLSIFTNGFSGVKTGTTGAAVVGGGQMASFQVASDPVACTENGKPVVELFSTSWCPHCQWISATFDKVAKEYANSGKITAYHWLLDTKEDTLTGKIYSSIPQAEMDIYQKFNPEGTIPTFVFGCKYYRIGNAYENEGDAGIPKEEAAFRAVIDALLASNTNTTN